MSDLRVCTQGVGFAALSLTATVALTSVSFGQGGEDLGSAVPIAIPSSQNGTTVGFLNDTAQTCPYSGSTSPDVYYSYQNTSDTDEVVSMTLCESLYDTQVYVFDDALAIVQLADGSGPACNDDFCTSAGGGQFRSFLTCVPVPAGGTIFICIDGWNGDSGSYNAIFAQVDPADCMPPGPCAINCPDGSTPEGEGCDFGDPAPDDTFNGGCNSSNPAGDFSPISCGETVCGQGYFDGAFRDTDWYELDTSGDANPTSFNLSGEAEFASVYGRVENAGGALSCAEITAFAEFVVTPGCGEVSVDTADLDPGLYWFFVGTDFTETVDCSLPDSSPGPDYFMTLTCTGALPPCPWDITGDMEVGFADLLQLLSNWGPCPE